MANSEPAKADAIHFGLNDGTFGLIMAAIFLFGAVIWSSDLPNNERTDFSLTYVGARIVLQGRGEYLYDLPVQAQIRDALFQHPSPLLYEHPPFEALLLSPLAALPFRSAYMVWGLVNAGVWILVMVFVRPHLPWPREDLAYFFLWFLFAPLAVALYQRQSSILLLAVYAVCFAQLKRNQEFAAGLALGFGLFKFQFVLPFALIFLFRQRWRFLQGFLGSSFVLGLLSLAAVGVKGLENYLRLLAGIAGHPENLSYGAGADMATLHGFLYTILPEHARIWGLQFLVALLSLLLIVIVAWRWQAALAGSTWELAFAAAVAASLVTGSHMFTHDFSPLLLAMFLAGAYFSRTAFPARRFLGLHAAMVFSLVVFWLFPIYFLFVRWHCLYLMCPVLLLFVNAALLGAKYIPRLKQAELQCVSV